MMYIIAELVIVIEWDCYSFDLLKIHKMRYED